MKKVAHKIRTASLRLNITADKRKTALLLHYAGPNVDDICDTLPTSNNEDYKAVVEKLNQYFSSQTVVAFEVFNFRQAKQKPDESLDSYHTRLHHLSQTCEFSDPDKEIKDHIILTCTSNSQRRRALRDNLNLPNLMKTDRAIEISDKQAAKSRNKSFPVSIQFATEINNTKIRKSQQPKTPFWEPTIA